MADDDTYDLAVAASPDDGFLYNHERNRSHFLLHHGGFKGQGATKGGAHQRMIQGQDSHKTRSQSQLGDRALVPQTAQGQLCCRGATAICQTCGRAQHSLLQDGQLYYMKPAWKKTVGTSVHRGHWNRAREMASLLLWCLSSCLSTSNSDCGL